MTNLLKIVIVFITAAVLFYGISKIGILAMLLISAFFILIALITFLIWATRPPATHRNNLQSFSMNFESKRIEFVPTENGLYQVNLCTKYFSEINARKETLEFQHSTDGAKTYQWQKMPLKLQKFYFTNDKAVQLSDKLLTEKQAKNLYFRLLKDAKTQSVANVIHISNLIESVSQPLFFTANRVQAFKTAKFNIQAKLQAFRTPPPLLESGKSGHLAKNGLWYVIFLQFNTVEMQAISIAENESETTLIMLLIALLVFGTIYNRLHDYFTNECIQQ